MITTAMEHFATLERASDLPLSLGTPRATSINTGHRGDLTTGHEPWRTENLRYNGRVSVTLRTISWVRGTSYSPKHMPKSALERGESSRCRSPDVAPDVGPDTVPMSHLKYTVSGESSRRPGATPGATSGARQASAAIAWARHIRTAAGYGVFEDVLGGARITSGVVQRISAFGAGSFWRTWRPR